MSNELDYGLAFSVADYFNLKEPEAKKIYDEVMLSVKNWEAVASGIGISRQEQLGMQEAFRV
jgi:serine/threonine-protein kinase HipA